jgi:endonuclease/exonuclease/phosphatase family metal-dependent hydrolase
LNNQRFSITTATVEEDEEPIESLCEAPIYFGGAIQLHVCGGIRVGLMKRSALSRKQKAAAVAAGVAGVALTGPLSAVFALGALGGGVGKYQMNKTYYLSIDPSVIDSSNSSSSSNSNSSKSNSGETSSINSCSFSSSAFLIENAELFSGPKRVLKYGDIIHLHSKDAQKNVKIAQAPNCKRGYFMIAKSESKTAQLRLLSPYGKQGQIVCGSQVVVQVVTGDWAKQYLSVYGSFLTSDVTPAVFKICKHQHQCHASEEIISITRSLTPQPFRVRILTYNVWMMPSFVSSIVNVSPNTLQRAQVIPKCIAALQVDVVVFCEVFCAQGRDILMRHMKEQGFLYETKSVGLGGSVSQKKIVDSGVFAMSKYPMEHYQDLTFGSVATGDDRMADKGILYFQIHKRKEEMVHVFGTHLQAWETPNAIKIRKLQLQMVKKFIQSMRIPNQDAVILAGDLNVDKWAENSKEYEEMLKILDFAEPVEASSDEEVQAEETQKPTKCSFDPLTNALAVVWEKLSQATKSVDPSGPFKSDTRLAALDRRR